MRPQDKIAINNMRMQGIRPSEMALRLNISVNTVRSHIRRHPDMPNTIHCLNCDGIMLTGKGRPKKFCCDKCRMQWWNTHSDGINRKAYYTLVCKNCGKEFESYGNKNRKFCSRECYKKSLVSIQSR